MLLPCRGRWRKRYTGAMRVPTFLAPLVDLVFPPRCPLCGDMMVEQAGVCPSCWSGLAIPGEPSCKLCQRPFAAGIAEGSICAPCLAVPPRHSGVAAGTLYNDASRSLVLALKHGGRIALAPLMARFVSARLPQRVDADWLVVPVPLHRWRLWRRGYNQAALLTRGIAESRGCSVLVDGLVRTRPTPTLGGLGRRGRARALSGAITVHPRRSKQIKGRRIVLVDDVLTSGATSDACTRALLRAGAQEVLIACFARVMDEALDLT